MLQKISNILRADLLAIAILAAMLALPERTTAQGAVVLDIPAGTVTVSGGMVKVDDVVVYEGRSAEIYDFGEAGVLIGAWTGLDDCPLTYHLIDPVFGELRTLNPADPFMGTVFFGDCRELMSVHEDEGFLVMAPLHDGGDVAVFLWDGTTFVDANPED